MVIKYSAQGAGSYQVLGDDTTGTAPPLITGFLPRLSGVPISDRMFQASNIKLQAGGNRQWEMKGTIATLHASDDAAADFIRIQSLAIPDFVDLQIIQGVTTFYLTPAVFTSFEPQIGGSSSIITYGFVASKITATAP